jgi:hypothetical protein
MSLSHIDLTNPGNLGHTRWPAFDPSYLRSC